MIEKKSKYFHRIEDLPLVWLTEESKSYIVSTENIMISFIENPPGCVFPLHSHPCEQIAIILEGEELHTCGDEKFLMKAGDMCIHPPNVMHSAETRTRVKAIDIFYPSREDHLEKLKKVLKEREEEG